MLNKVFDSLLGSHGTAALSRMGVPRRRARPQGDFGAERRHC